MRQVYQLFSKRVMFITSVQKQPHIFSRKIQLILAFLFLIISFSVLGSRPVSATTGINEQLNYQARLLTSGGAVVADGTYNIEFKIYQDGAGCEAGGSSPCGGTLKWTETRTGADKVTVRNGYFSVSLGSVTPFSTNVDWNQDILWLSINIGGTGSPSWDGEMTPFRRIAAAAYALNAKQLGGLDWSKFVQIAPAAAQVDASTLSGLFVNKTGASGNILQLQKNAADVLTVGNDGKIQIGASDTTGALLVLDTKTDTGDPTGVNGGMYYNSNSGKFRCYQNSTWADCIGSGGSISLQAAYDVGNTITTTTGRDIKFDLADTATDSSFLVDIQCDTGCTGGNGRFAIQDDGVDVFTVNPGDGSTYLRNSLDSTQGFAVLNSSNVTLFTANTEDSVVYIGDLTADATGALFVLDTKNTAGDPANGTIGSMYYNSDAGKFRCFQGVAWTDCIGAGGSTTMQQAYDAGNTVTTTTGRNVLFTMPDVATDPSFLVNLQCDTCGGNNGRFAVQDDGTDVFTINPGGGTASFINLENSTIGFEILNDTGIPLFTVDTTNSQIELGNQTADGTGAILILDTKNTAGDPTGVAGGMYYNSSSATFRCHNTTWNDCSPHRKKKTGDQSSTSTTNANVTDLSYSVAASTDYNFSCDVIFNTAITTTGIGLAFTTPASPTLISYTAEIPAAGDGVNGNLQGWGTASDDAVIGTGVQTASTNYIGRIWGTLRNGTNAGTLQLRFRTEIASSNVTIKAGSNCEMWQI